MFLSLPLKTSRQCTHYHFPSAPCYPHLYILWAMASLACSRHLCCPPNLYCCLHAVKYIACVCENSTYESSSPSLADMQQTVEHPLPLSTAAAIPAYYQCTHESWSRYPERTIMVNLAAASSGAAGKETPSLIHTLYMIYTSKY